MRGHCTNLENKAIVNRDTMVLESLRTEKNEESARLLLPNSAGHEVFTNHYSDIGHRGGWCDNLAQHTFRGKTSNVLLCVETPMIRN